MHCKTTHNERECRTICSDALFLLFPDDSKAILLQKVSPLDVIVNQHLSFPRQPEPGFGCPNPVLEIVVTQPRMHRRRLARRFHPEEDASPHGMTATDPAVSVPWIAS